MKTRQLDIRAHFWSKTWRFRIFLSYWVWAKNAQFFKNHISNADFITLKTKFVAPNYINMLHMTLILIFISYFDKTKLKILWAKLVLKCSFTMWVLRKMSCWDLVTVFKKYLIWLNNSVKKHKKIDQCLWIVIWVHLSQNGLLDKNVGYKIGPFELIFNPHIEKHQTYPVSFLKKINLIIKKR